MLNRDELIDLVEQRYFNAMDQGRLDETLACLSPDCVWRVYPAGAVLNGRDGEIRDAFADAIAHYKSMWHGNFEWTIDEAAQRVAAHGNGNTNPKVPWYCTGTAIQTPTPIPTR